MAETRVELEQIGAYPILRLLKTGSTSSLYQGKLRKKEVVIRVLHTPLITLEAKEAFLTRTRSLKKLANRNIIQVHESGFTQSFGTGEDDHPYIVMQYVEGETLRQRFPAGQQVALDEVKKILSPVASSLNYAHVNNVIHANLHPGNILIAARNDIVLTDFSLTLSTMVDNTSAVWPYMALEHLRGTPTAASDQYALAVMVYEWLCGRRPYEAASKEQLLQQQEQEEFPLPTSLNSHISPAVEQVLLQALARNPDERYQQVQTLADNYLHALMGLPPKVETKRGVVVLPKTTQIVREDVTVGAQFIAPTSSGTRIEGAMGDQGAMNCAPTKDDTSYERQKIILPAPATNSRLHDTVTADLCQGGVLSERLPGYEERPAQIEMATLVARSLTEGIPAIVEAGTGTGKSLAYLIPIVRSGKVAIISTANKALQEQLFYKDIPFVQKHIKHFEAALVKGIGNYLCLDRLENERVGIQYYAKNREFMRLLDVTQDPDTDFTGDFETLGFQLPTDIRGKVCADSDQCAWHKCSFYADCYVRDMRTRAERAQIIVVNHTLLLLDALMDGYLLPERDVIVLDEAHHLEEEATRSFTVTISPNSITTLLAQKMLKTHSNLSLQDEAEKAMQKAWDRLQMVASMEKDLRYKGRANLREPVEEGLRLATVIGDLADSLRKQRPKDLPEKETQLYDKLLKRTQNLAQNIRTVFSIDQPGKFVYYIERVGTTGQRGFQLQVSAAPLDITSWLKERLFDKSNVICTSATLATIGPNPANPTEKGPNFAYFRRRIGLDPLENPDVIERILPLSFDYESNALLYVPRDLPAPAYGEGSDDYAKAIAREMYRLVKLSRGRAFLLFSSKRMMDQAYDLMSPHLDYPLLKQGDMTRMELTRRFREEQGAILFGLKSFWEGVDIVGEALSLVVIDKLPFDPPDDPVHEARVAQMKAAGENWFGIYVLPQVVLRLKQGLGRLLRTREDRGVMAILDTRIYTKGYGKMVLDALPPAHRTANIKDVARFFANES